MHPTELRVLVLANTKKPHEFSTLSVQIMLQVQLSPTHHVRGPPRSHPSRERCVINGLTSKARNKCKRPSFAGNPTGPSKTRATPNGAHQSHSKSSAARHCGHRPKIGTLGAGGDAWRTGRCQQVHAAACGENAGEARRQCHARGLSIKGKHVFCDVLLFRPVTWGITLLWPRKGGNRLYRLDQCTPNRSWNVE